MNKRELVEATALETKLTQKDTEAVINTFFELVTKSLAENDKVQLSGFGTFNVKERKLRVGKDPRTGEKIVIDAHNLPTFKVGKRLKEAVNG